MTLTLAEIKEITEKLQNSADVLFDLNRPYSAYQLLEIVWAFEEHLEKA